jgi:spore maturation protein CgeB
LRIVVTDTVYPQFLDDHYAANPNLAQASYSEQLEALHEASFGTSDAYTHHLRELGHEALDIVVNCEPLQAAWVRENRRRGPASWLQARAGGRSHRDHPEAIAKAQIEAFDPDVILVHDVLSMSPDHVRRHRNQGRLLVSQTASRLPAAYVYGAYDFLLSSFHHFVRLFREQGIDSEYFQLGFYDRVLERLVRAGVATEPAAKRPVPLSFIGGLDPGVYDAAVPVLEAVAKRVPLEVWGYDEDKLAPGSPLRNRFHGGVWGIDMYRVLAESRITINRHGEIAEGQANNMRLYEATGVGALLLTEAADNLSDILEPGVEVVTYEGGEDLVAKIERYLSDDESRIEIAAAGQRRTLAEHTYRERMRELSEMLKARVPGR